MAGRDYRIKTLAVACPAIMILFLSACRQEAASQDVATATPSATPSIASPTRTPTPSSTPTAREVADSLGTIQAELSAEPCTAQEVLAYSNQVLPLAEEHLQAAQLALSMQPWQESQGGVDRAYREATERVQALEDITPPPCADLVQLKFMSHSNHWWMYGIILGKGSSTLHSVSCSPHFTRRARHPSSCPRCSSGSKTESLPLSIHLAYNRY